MCRIVPTACRRKIDVKLTHVSYVDFRSYGHEDLRERLHNNSSSSLLLVATKKCVNQVASCHSIQKGRRKRSRRHLDSPLSVLFKTNDAIVTGPQRCLSFFHRYRHVLNDGHYLLAWCGRLAWEASSHSLNVVTWVYAHLCGHFALNLGCVWKLHYRITSSRIVIRYFICLDKVLSPR